MNNTNPPKIMTSTTLFIRLTASTAPFRFLDLPVEIRNQTYRLLLTPSVTTTTNTDGDKIRSLNLSLETQILRVCHSIQSEATRVLRANLFIKLTIKVLIQEFGFMLHSETIAIAILKSKQAQTFKAHVLEHEITLPKTLQEPTRVIVILFKDLKELCAGIQQAQSPLTQHNDLVSHIITLRDPFPRISSREGVEPFLSRDLQETLLAPYRAEFRDCPFFKVKGTADVSKDLRLATEKEIVRPLPTDPEGVIREIEHLKAEGNLYFTRGDLYFRDGNAGASEYWNLALQKIHLVLNSSSSPYTEIRQQGGKELLNRLVALSFTLNSNKAQDYLKCMECHADNQDQMDAFGTKLSDSVWEAFCTPSKYSGSIWRPTNAQTAKLAYRKAVRCRIGGEPLMFSQAQTAIQQALILFPNDVAIKKESELIAKWGRRIFGR
ncbi:hypothetical protein ONS96_010753 [Cadophora gregata f. sp. sojae]|nr:hypothetical protein ONS96_010753 [Cadophora gregata f. sp. sojae]